MALSIIRVSDHNEIRYPAIYLYILAQRYDLTADD